MAPCSQGRVASDGSVGPGGNRTALAIATGKYKGEVMSQLGVVAASVCPKPRTRDHALGGVFAQSLQHILDAREFSRQWVEQVLFPMAEQFQKMPLSELPQTLATKRLFYLFYEPSTRTRVSFEAAATLLGGMVMGMDGHKHNAGEERLEDRIQVLSEYGYDFIVLRYHEEGGARQAAAVSSVPIINAGDGSGQHPTQALLDTYTIWRELGQICNLRIALMGDLSYERTVNSLAYLLARFPGVRLYLVSPSLLRIRQEVRDYLDMTGTKYEEPGTLADVAPEIDVVYLTKAHSPRMDHACRFDRKATCYGIDAEILAQLRSDTLVLHPLPRGPELPPEFDSDPRIGCFRQARNGLFVRMALLSVLAAPRH